MTFVLRLRSSPAPAAMMSEFAAQHPANPLNEKERVTTIDGKQAGVTMHPFGDKVMLHSLRAVTKGGGRAAMDHITDLADRHGVAIGLHALPQAPGGTEGYQMKTEKLQHWYGGFGFTQHEGGYMERKPNLLKAIRKDVLQAAARKPGSDPHTPEHHPEVLRLHAAIEKLKTKPAPKGVKAPKAVGAPKPPELPRPIFKSITEHASTVLSDKHVEYINQAIDRHDKIREFMHAHVPHNEKTASAHAAMTFASRRIEAAKNSASKPDKPTALQRVREAVRLVGNRPPTAMHHARKAHQSMNEAEHVLVKTGYHPSPDNAVTKSLRQLAKSVARIAEDS